GPAGGDPRRPVPRTLLPRPDRALRRPARMEHLRPLHPGPAPPPRGGPGQLAQRRLPGHPRTPGTRPRTDSRREGGVTPRLGGVPDETGEGDHPTGTETRPPREGTLPTR